VGKDSQQGGLTGQFNTSIGQDSLLGINGASTCASGADTNWTGNNNTGLGYGAGCNISGSAADNTFAGFESFGATTAVFTGSGNTGMGSNSGRTCVSCANDTFIGFNADASASGRANSIAIGNGASATADNFAYFGNASVTGFKIGVGFGLSKPSSVVLCGNGTNGDGSCIFQAAQVQASANVGMFDPFMAFSSSGVAAWTNGANYTGTRDVGLSRTAAGVLSVGNGTASDVTGTIKAGAYNTGTNCSSSAAPAVCGSACAGSVVVAAGATTVTVNTTCTTASSQIFIQPDASLNTKLSVTCNTTGTLLDAEAWVSARTGGTSFVITVNAAPSVNPECFSYFIVN
jgi:hypothetical protein